MFHYFSKLNPVCTKVSLFYCKNELFRKIGLRCLSQTNRRVKSTESTSPSIYKNVAFYKYLDTFLENNNLNCNVPGNLNFVYKDYLTEFIELSELLSIKNQDAVDEEFLELANKEYNSLIEKLINLQNEIFANSLVDDGDVTECTVEFRAGVGGKEASLFSDELHNLYLKFILLNGWNIRTNQEEFEQVKIEENSSLASNVVEVIGANCYRLLRHEAGIHRVQRVFIFIKCFL